LGVASTICGPAECSVGYVSLWNPLCWKM